MINLTKYSKQRRKNNNKCLSLEKILNNKNVYQFHMINIRIIRNYFSQNKIKNLCNYLSFQNITRSSKKKT